MEQTQRRPKAHSGPALLASQTGPLLSRAAFPRSFVPVVHAPEPVHSPLHLLPACRGQARAARSLVKRVSPPRRYTELAGPGQESVCPELLVPVSLQR